MGSIVNPAQCQWLNLVPYMIQCKAPIWLCWGPQPPPLVNFWLSWVLLFYPHHLPMSSPPIPIPAGFPPVKPNCGQLPRETWMAFFQRRAQKNSEKETIENAKERQVQLNREKANKTHQQPGHRGPHVFYWEEIDGFCICTLWTHGETEMV